MTSYRLLNRSSDGFESMGHTNLLKTVRLRNTAEQNTTKLWVYFMVHMVNPLIIFSRTDCGQSSHWLVGLSSTMFHLYSAGSSNNKRSGHYFSQYSQQTLYSLPMRARCGCLLWVQSITFRNWEVSTFYPFVIVPYRSCRDILDRVIMRADNAFAAPPYNSWGTSDFIFWFLFPAATKCADIFNWCPSSDKHMMTSSNGNIFRVTGHLCGEFTGPRWFPRTKASDAELWCFLWSASE